jgi:hypothetical protein
MIGKNNCKTKDLKKRQRLCYIMANDAKGAERGVNPFYRSRPTFINQPATA